MITTITAYLPWGAAHAQEREHPLQELRVARLLSPTRFPSHAHLISMNLSGACLSNTVKIEDFPYLETLDLSQNGLRYIYISSLPRLRSADVSSNPILDLVLKKLPMIQLVDTSQNRNWVFNPTIELRELPIISKIEDGKFIFYSPVTSPQRESVAALH